MYSVKNIYGGNRKYNNMNVMISMLFLPMCLQCSIFPLVLLSLWMRSSYVFLVSFSPSLSSLLALQSSFLVSLLVSSMMLLFFSINYFSENFIVILISPALFTTKWGLVVWFKCSIMFKSPIILKSQLALLMSMQFFNVGALWIRIPSPGPSRDRWHNLHYLENMDT